MGGHGLGDMPLRLGKRLEDECNGIPEHCLLFQGQDGIPEEIS